MQELTRTKVNQFKIENSCEIDDIDETKIITIEELFNNKEKIELDNKKLELFLNGVQLTYNNKDGIYRIYNYNNFIGLGVIKDNLLKRDIII